MDSHELRTQFTGFFAARGHVVRPSASLIPADPTLLLTSAGMVPFKPYFLGDEAAPWDRAASIQKCVRTSDIGIIGTTQRHLSFFEMMGNFSFGDYFKEDAIKWAYEFSTEVMGMDAGRLWFTVYDTDDEARQIWVDSVGVPAERVQNGGQDNFWQMGVPGPCGPSSELWFDRGEEFGEPGGPVGGGGDRFVEYWNLVFMQNIQDEPYHVIGDLPDRSIDTGMGLDRLAVLLQGVPSVFDIDTISHIRDIAADYTGLVYGDSDAADVSLRILADHARSVSFLIADGVTPSNDGRGYVLRRLLRRAVRHAWQYGGRGLVMPRLVDATVDVMGEWYTELSEQRDHLGDVVTREEEKFRRTLESGHQLLDTELEANPEILPGPTIFRLHDTFGFPVELTEEIASERGVELDREGFEREMQAQRERARAAWRGSDDTIAVESIYRSILEEIGLTDFVGYTEMRADATVLSLVGKGEVVDSAGEGEEVEIFLDRTPFYGESGGQVGDIGRMEGPEGMATVYDTQHVIQGLHGHRARVSSGKISVGDTVTAVIDVPRREAIRKSHTGTHVLHWALRDVLGEHASQAGSLVESGRLRFDFSHFSQMAPEELATVETLVNERLIENGQVSTTVTSKDDAEEMGAIAFFGDKYGEEVRVVKVGDFSTEFCGGTHTHSAGEVGPLLVTSESSIGSNLRRVEALTGLAAYEHLVEVRNHMDDISRLLKTQPSDTASRVRGLLERVDGLEEQLETIRAQRRGELARELASEAEKQGDVSQLIASVPDLNGDQLRQVALGVRDALPSPCIVVVGSVVGGKAALVAVVSRDLVDKGVSAAELITSAAGEVGGGGSRDPELAQAGGPDGQKMPKALELAREATRGASKAL